MCVSHYATRLTPGNLYKVIDTFYSHNMMLGIVTVKDIFDSNVVGHYSDNMFRLDADISDLERLLFK